MVGRADECTLRLESELSSAEHAVITWSGGQWNVRDLGSRNGTFVADARIEPGERVVLDAGAVLRFGGADETWRLRDTSPPGARARGRDTGEAVDADSGMLFLPGADKPLASVFRGRDGAWVVERDGEIQAVSDQDVIELAGAAWCLELPPSQGATVATTRRLADRPLVLEEMTLVFRVSADEEYVELLLRGADSELSLGARAHHYLLLTLSRARLDGRARDPGADTEHGWLYVDELANMLSTDRQGVNLSVFRARKQLAEAGVHNAGHLCERRSTSHQIRLGVERVRIERI